MLCKSLVKGLNEQVNMELASSYYYLGLSVALDAMKLPGMAHWMRVQSVEELGHASRFLDILRQCDAQVELAKIEKPEITCDNVADIFKAAHRQEELITAHLSKLAAQAVEEKDYAALSLLQSFLTEQLEEEHTVRKLRDYLALGGKNGDSMLLLDFELARRPCQCTTQCFCGESKA